jgi:acyl carrier protein
MEEQIKDILAKKFQIKLSEITNETPLMDIAEDSLGKLEMLFEIEEVLDIQIPHDAVIEIGTVGELIEAIKKVK